MNRSGILGVSLAFLLAMGCTTPSTPPSPGTDNLSSSITDPGTSSITDPGTSSFTDPGVIPGTSSVANSSSTDPNGTSNSVPSSSIYVASSAATSSSNNITATCGTGQLPTPISGGTSGWGSRYWDCCKPSCSWRENTMAIGTPNGIARNCSATNQESMCFIDRGTWFEGTKSGCEASGEAFTCYSNAPYAVCDKLAYGFAAVPSSTPACGKCFQLDFNGGAKYGTPKPAHLLMKGKTMIVMASNTGGDVGSGQFDILIPGGGLGAFKDGCAKQWGVDVNNTALVGETYGGFTSTCQAKLGWDAPVASYKACVIGMCDKLFGTNPALSQLYEGCKWYANWMNAVDNPTFTYKEVTCPAELVAKYKSSFH